MGPIILALLLGTDYHLSFGLRFITIRNIPQAFRLLLAPVVFKVTKEYFAI